MRLTHVVLFSLLSILSSQLLAKDDQGLYLGAGVTSGVTDKESMDERDTSYKGYLGFRPNGYLAFEGAVVDLGNFSDNDEKFDGKSVQVAAHLGFPLGDRLRLFASVGGHAWSSDGDAAGEDGGVDLSYGAGAELDLIGSLGVRAEYEIFEVGNMSIDQASASVFLLF